MWPGGNSIQVGGEPARAGLWSQRRASFPGFQNKHREARQFKQDVCRHRDWNFLIRRWARAAEDSPTLGASRE